MVGRMAVTTVEKKAARSADKTVELLVLKTAVDSVALMVEM